jgi:hypothetical protein
MVARAIGAFLVAAAAIAHADAAVPNDAVDGPLECSHAPGWPTQAEREAAEKFSQEAAGYVFERRIGGNYVYDAGFWSVPQHTLVLDATTGARKFFIQDGPSEIVLGKDGTIDGALVVGGHRRRDISWYDQSGVDAKPKWTDSIKDFYHDRAAIVVDGKSLIVATWAQIATGSRLFRIERATGRIEWEADVEQLVIGHSKYWNHVSLAMRGGRLVMRGDEAGGCYVETFDPATGKRLSSRTRYR